MYTINFNLNSCQQNRPHDTLTAAKGSGTNVAAVTEEYTYDAYGKVSTRALMGQTYSYAYKNNAERELDYISLPNTGLRSKTESDVNDRVTERLLQTTAGENQFGTYLYYRKHGNRATRMVSSIRYGNMKNGKYVIGNGLKYKYDAAGNIAEVYENGISAVRYTYDSLSRLVREDNRNVGKTFLFAYDNNGNILSNRSTSYTLRDTEKIVDFDSILLYTYDGVQGDRLVDINGSTVTYDQIGNPTSYFGKALTWQKGRQLASFDTVNFTYDGSGKRIKKNNTVFTYSPDGKLLKQSDGTDTLEFLYDGSGIVAFKYNDTHYIYRKNVSGDIVEILDMSGNSVVRYDYDAWGRHATSGTMAETLGKVNPFRYRGYYYDVETGLFYVGSRYYDPTVCRWINSDDVKFLVPELISGLNLYAYCNNNPVNMSDESGHWPQWIKNVVKTVASVVTQAKAVLSIPSTVVKIVAASTVAVVSGKATVGDVLNDVKNYSFFNTDETKVLNSKVFSSYKETPVLRHDISAITSFSISNTIILNKNETINNGGIDSVKHEWGHTVQQSLLGTPKYLTRIAAPSGCQQNRPYDISYDILVKQL